MTPDASEAVRYTFAGSEFDEETGQIYCRKLYYDARIGAFLVEDPAGTVFDDNFSRFVETAPTCKCDVNGLSRLAAGAGSGFAIGELPGTLFGGIILLTRSSDGDAVESTDSGEGAQTGQCPIPGVDETGKTRRGSKTGEKTGSVDQANEDFDNAVEPGSVQDRGDGVRTGTGKDGNHYAVRPGSTRDGRPTVDVKRGGKTKWKIRNNDQSADKSTWI